MSLHISSKGSGRWSLANFHTSLNPYRYSSFGSFVTNDSSICMPQNSNGSNYPGSFHRRRRLRRAFAILHRKCLKSVLHFGVLAVMILRLPFGVVLRSSLLKWQERMQEWMKEWMNDYWLADWVSEWMNQWHEMKCNEWINEWNPACPPGRSAVCVCMYVCRYVYLKATTDPIP